MKCQILCSGKNEKSNTEMLSAELAQKVIRLRMHVYFKERNLVPNTADFDLTFYFLYFIFF